MRFTADRRPTVPERAAKAIPRIVPVDRSGPPRGAEVFDEIRFVRGFVAELGGRTPVGLRILTRSWME